MNGQKSKRNIIMVITILCVALGVLGFSFLVDFVYNRTVEKVESEELEEQAQKQVELTVTYAYQNPIWNAAIENMIHEFEEANPDITISYEVSYEDQVYEDILSKKIARNELGDIVQLKNPESYAQGNLLGEISDDVAGLVSSTYTLDGKTYGVGAVESTWGILYNKEIFQKYGLEEPATYQDFLNICGFLSRREITPIGVGGSDLWHMEYWVNHFFRSDIIAQDPDWLKKCQTGEVSWTDELPQKMMEHLCEVFQDGYVNADWLTTTDTSLSYLMSQGSVAMIYTSPWSAASIQSMAEDMELGWFYVPDENGQICAADNLDTFWAVTHDCEADEDKYEAAMRFFTFFYSKESYSELCMSTYTFPISKSNSKTSLDDFHQDVLAAFQSADLRITAYIGNEDTPEDFEKSMLDIVRKVLSGELTAEDGLLQIQEVWEQCEMQGGGS